jgi:hypothetical protein
MHLKKNDLRSLSLNNYEKLCMDIELNKIHKYNY